MRIGGGLRLLVLFEQWTDAGSLPAYSDRIAQDLHLIPFYPRIVARTALNLRGTENMIGFNCKFIITHRPVSVNEENKAECARLTNRHGSSIMKLENTM